MFFRLGAIWESMSELCAATAYSAENRIITEHVTTACAGAHVLVVDDDTDFRKLARRLLEPDGIRVTEAESADQAFSYLEEHADSVSVVLMDLVMPGRDGIQAIRELKRRFPHVPVIAVSGADSAELYLSISALFGANSVLRKSKLERLTESIWRILNQ